VGALMTSLRTLRAPRRHHIYRPWLATVAGRLSGMRLELLTALEPVGPYVPDFLTPAPAGTDVALADELAAVAATEPSVVRAELELMFHRRPVPAVLRPLYEDPARHLAEVVDEMERYWRAAVEPIWPRIRALGEADVHYRLERFAAGGVLAVLSELSPELVFDGDRVLIRRNLQYRTDLGGRGLVLVPSAFVWPGVLVAASGDHQRTVYYPLRGVADMCEPARPGRGQPLAALVGRTRASLLRTLRLPLTTTELAAQLDMSPAAISQHLKILKESALVDSRRRGRAVLYQRTEVGTTLVDAYADR